MAAIDLLINEVAERFGIGGKAISLMSGLLLLMTDRQRGGIPGFIDRFKQAGMEPLVNSWVGGGSNQPITPEQLETALGRETIERLARDVGLSRAGAAAALALLTPLVIDYLTPDGIAPPFLPAWFTLPSSGIVGTTLDPSRAARLTWHKILRCVAVGVAVFLSYRHYRGGLLLQSAAISPLTIRNPATVNSTLFLRNVGGAIRFSGVMPDEESRREVLGQLEAAFGRERCGGELTVDRRARPVLWLGHFGAALRDLKHPGVELGFDGNQIRVGGSLSASARADLAARLVLVFGSTARIAENLN
ncbi:MAG TPA: YidB family protein [Blastocatellia bacterium]|nr:YidB family protein [Blastocatellia bacterium]